MVNYMQNIVLGLSFPIGYIASAVVFIIAVVLFILAFFVKEDKYDDEFEDEFLDEADEFENELNSPKSTGESKNDEFGENISFVGDIENLINEGDDSTDNEGIGDTVVIPDIKSTPKENAFIEDASELSEPGNDDSETLEPINEVIEIEDNSGNENEADEDVKVVVKTNTKPVEDNKKSEAESFADELRRLIEMEEAAEANKKDE